MMLTPRSYSSLISRVEVMYTSLQGIHKGSIWKAFTFIYSTVANLVLKLVAIGRVRVILDSLPYKITIHLNFSYFQDSFLRESTRLLLVARVAFADNSPSALFEGLNVFCWLHNSTPYSTSRSTQWMSEQQMWCLLMYKQSWGRSESVTETQARAVGPCV